MRMIELHDHMNPTQVVPVDADAIEGVVPFGSGSSLQPSSGNVIGVHETPEQVERIVSGDESSGW
jgi:hypothetical protein